MTENRPPIPADLERRVLLEAGHRCAIPTCRHIEVEIHHIIPWNKCKKHEYENLIALCPNCHKRADSDDIDRKSLRAYKANLRLAHDKFSNFEVDMLFGLHNKPDGWFEVPHFLLLLINRILQAGYVQIRPISSLLKVRHEGTPSGLIVTDVYKVTLASKGKEYIESLGNYRL